jgi:thiamine biosynthesis lipoprotein
LAASAVEKVERLTNPDIEDSDLARVNREAFAKDVEIAPETVTAIERALYWTQRSGGAFDLTAGPLVRLWRQAAEAGNLPDNGQIQQALSLKGCSEVRLGRSNRTVRLAREGMRLDLGGVAVGYAMDLAARALRSSGVRCAELRIEDDLCAFGRQSSGGKPTMVIEHPARRGKVLGAFEVTDAAVATVRCSQGAFKVGDKWYSGIINPQTGRPTEQVVSTTVMTTNGADAEALAHALFVLGPDAGKALIDKLPTTEALILSVDPANPGGFRTVVTQKLKALMKWQVEK